MLNRYKGKLFGLALCVGLFGNNAFAESADSLSNKIDLANPEKNSFKLSLKNTILRKIDIKSLKSDSTEEKFGYQKGKKLGLFAEDLVVSGTVRFITIFRNMTDVYPDMLTAKKNLSFVDYPLGGAAIAQGAYPTLELNLASKVSQRMDFNVGYSFAYFFRGNQDNDASRYISSIQNLRFGANFHTSIGKFTVNAGQILPLKMSKFTLGQTIYRDDYFDRLPWDWYRNSFLRYDEYYSLKVNMGGFNESRALFSGIILSGNILPLGVSVTTFAGRTSLTSPYNAGSTGFPGILYGGRVEKSVFTKKVNGKIGSNNYLRKGYSALVDGLKDNNSMFTVDADFKFKGLKIVSEIGYSRINNRFIKNDGIGTQVRVDFDKTYLPLPIFLDFYYIQSNFANYDGGVLNTNRNLRQGGSATGIADDPTVFTNLNQEVSQYANNRIGAIFKTNARIAKKLSIDFGYAASQEIVNINDSVVSMQHRVNSFSRSRFNQWKMNTGPYNQVRSIFRRTIENVAITNPNTDHKKGFNTVEAMVMYKSKLLARDLVIMSYHTYGSTQEKFSLIPTWDKQTTYFNQFYNENTIAYKFAKKLMAVADYSIELAKGGMNTRLAENGKPLDQFGKSIGIGLDYDFMKTGGLHLRHKWFSHQDKNFVLDKFKGQETYVELKIFF